MKIIEFYAENLLCLKAVPITPDGRVVEITGKNGSGKSSVLNAIYYALAGTKHVGSRPVRKGTERAIIRLKIAGESKEITVTRRFTAGGGTSLTVESADGAVFRSPQALLDKLIEGLTFDPLAFSRMPTKQQYETLRALVPLDIDVDALDKANAADYDRRTDVNRQIVTKKERVKALAAEVDVTLANTPLRSVSALTKQLADAGEHNATVESVLRMRKDDALSLIALRGSLIEKRELAARLAVEIEQIQDEVEAEELRVAQLPALAEPTDVSALREEIDGAIAANTAIEVAQRRAAALAEAQRDLDAATVMSKNLSDAIDARTKEKQDAIARAKMPIPGLSFGDGELLYNDNPYAQASMGESLRVATSIGMALNPNLKIIFIRDASLLDEDGRQVVLDLAEEHDYQAWLETVSPTPTIGFHMVDGRIAAIDGVPVPEPEPESADEAEPAGATA